VLTDAHFDSRYSKALGMAILPNEAKSPFVVSWNGGLILRKSRPRYGLGTLTSTIFEYPLS